MTWWTKLFGKKEKSDAHASLNLTDGDRAVLRALDPRIVVGKVLEIAPHPDSSITKVRVAKMNLGNGRIEQILCGGTNLKSGFVVAVATVGAKLSKDFEISVRKIANVPSHGMICARAELGLSPAGEVKGEIWPLSAELETKVGTSLCKL